MVYHWWPRDESGVSIETEQSGEDTATVVKLSDAKRAVANICVASVSRQSLQLTRMLPARFAYDERRHVAVRAATDGVLASLLVKPGDIVQSGQRIAVMRSPDIGSARGRVLQAQSALELAMSESEWQEGICHGVEELVASIRAGKTESQIESDLNDAKLGKYRGQLLTTYSKSKLTGQLADSAISSEGAISGRVVRQRKSQHQQSSAELDAVIEQSLFETKQACNASAANAEVARRDLINAKQSLATLLGEIDATDGLDVSPSEQDLAKLTITSPLQGTVEQTRFSATERVLAGAEMFVIADTSRLWVEADVRERDWSALQLHEHDEVTISTSAHPDHEIVGTVYYIGREVDRATGAIPLVIEVSNDSGRFRPGLFARVEVPINEVTDVIVVPASAVVDIEGSTTVFVAENDGYRPVRISIGSKTDQTLEVVSGLEEGQQVVVAGAFVLKSELLLEGEG